MPEWLFDFLSGPTIKIAAAIWNSSMKLIIKLVCSTPQKFSTGTWAFVKEYNDNHIFYLISDGERSLYDRCPRFKSRGYGYWLSIVLSAIWLALYTGSDRLQLFDVMDSIQPVHKAISAHDISTLCDVCTCRRSGDRA